MADRPVPHLVVQPRELILNPSAAQLKAMVEKMPNAKSTAFGNLNVETKVLARSKASTYVVTDTPEAHSDQTLPNARGAELAKIQDDYIRTQSMVVIDGYIGPDPQTRVACRLMVEARNANIAAMQQQLYFTPTAAELKDFKPELQVLYTPNLKAAGFPNDRCIAVFLNTGITRVFNSDYFGESKKGGLRMWNKLMYDRGGLAMHAGCKIIPVAGKKRVALIIGLSGTGKTTTTFTRQNASQPIQDDFIGLLPDGSVVATENGCFAKTYALDPKSEPMIYGAVTQPQAYLENVSQKADGSVDFFDESYTQNGRSTFPFSLIPELGDISHIPKVDFILILNRNENIIPAVAKLTSAQGAAYFMLGETKGTAAGGAEEAGKALRVPGTNPFFPLLHAQQGTRFLELMKKLTCDVYLMNTGWVGGVDGTPHSRKVKIKHSSAVVKGIAEGTIKWKKDPDFHYEIATHVDAIDASDSALLCPKDYYEQTGRQADYSALVTKLRADRAAHLKKFPGLTADIVAAVSS
jgi:phosphoenolpyruvate carboxykinase (ATP)